MFTGNNGTVLMKNTSIKGRKENYHEVREERSKRLFAQHYNSLLPPQAFLINGIRLKLMAHYNVLERATFN